MKKLQPVPDTPPRAWIYVRQSHEHTDSISPAVQEQACRDYAARQGYTVAQVISDLGVSGLRWEKRPGIQAVMGAVKDGQADVILLWRWSRLSRSRLHQAVALDTIEKTGARVESATEPFDTTTAGGAFGRDVMLAAAAFESQQKGEQWRDAHRRRRDAGLPHHGRPKIGYTYTGHYTPDPDTAPMVVEAYRRYVAGAGAHQIAHLFAAHGHPMTARGALYALDCGFAAGYLQIHDPDCRCGARCTRTAWVPGAQPAIIDPPLWDAYRHARAETVATAPRLRAAVSALSGAVICDGCGKPMQYFRAGPRPPAFYCRGDGTLQARCPARARVREDVAELAVQHWLPRVAGELDDLAGKAPTAAGRVGVARLARQVAAADTALTKLVGDFARGIIPERAYLDARDELVGERDTAQAELDRDQVQARRVEGFRPAAVTLLDGWGKLEPWAANRLVRKLFRVQVTRNPYRAPGVRVVGVWELS